MTSSPAGKVPLPTSPRPIHRALPGGIWVLGLGSMFMDMSSELVHSVLPIFMATVLGASMVTIGLIEGIAEAAASVTKVFSGALSDYFRKRKFLVVLGYGLGAITKPVFPLATSLWWVFGARFVDRIGKGIRGAPRDALIADIVPPKLRGAAYGLRQSLDSVGAFLGPLLAVVFMLWLANDIKAVLWVAVVPAFIAVLLLMLALREPEPRAPAAGPGNRLTFMSRMDGMPRAQGCAGAVSRMDGMPRAQGCAGAAKRLSLRYWLVVALGAVFTLARFSEAFLILRAQDVGLAIAYVPAIMIVMNIAYALGAYPAGVAADRLSARTLLLAGLGVLVGADVLLALATSPLIVFPGAALWGLHMALTQGLLAKLVADTAPAELRGTAFGVFNLVSGGALLLASLIAGSLWSIFGAWATFIAGAGFASLAAIGLLLYGWQTRTGARQAGRKP